MAKMKSIRVDEATWRTLRQRSLDSGYSVGRLVAEMAHTGYTITPADIGGIVSGNLIYRPGQPFTPAAIPEAPLPAVFDDPWVDTRTVEPDAYSQAPTRKAKR